MHPCMTASAYFYEIPGSIVAPILVYVMYNKGARTTTKFTNLPAWIFPLKNLSVMAPSGFELMILFAPLITSTSDA